MKTFGELAIGDVFTRTYENVKRPYRKLTGEMAAGLLTGHRFFFVPNEEVAEAEAAHVTTAAGLAAAFGVDVEVAKTAVSFLTQAGEQQAAQDCRVNQAAFFGRKDEG